MDKIYLFCAIFGGVLVVLQFLTSLFGFGGDDLSGDAAADADGGGEIGAETDVPDDGGFAFLKAFSLRSLTAGLAFFGLAGMAGREAGWPEFQTLGVAVAAGLTALFGVFYLLRTLTALRGDGSIKPSTATGCVGSVYLRIPAKRGGVGKVEIVQQGRTMEYDAATDDENDLPTGAAIVVVKPLSASQMLVARRRD